MSCLWIVSGAGRDVGKTHVALALCELLPDAVYAKCGGGRRKPGRPENLFSSEAELDAFVSEQTEQHKHIVVEYNGWARQGRGDVIIYIGPIVGHTKVRNDADELRAAAHIVIERGGSIRGWRRRLQAHVRSRALCESVVDLFVEHKRHVCRLGPTAHCKLWFVVGDLHVFGSGLAQLLELADEHGTLRDAARDAEMSYRYAWDLLKTAEKHLGRTLLTLQPGGATGGQASLTDEGRRLLDVYRQLQVEVADFAQERFARRYCGAQGSAPVEAST
ncbi:MAG: LysR family transcriptional regulator [Phycisphaerales bacterium]|nr:LysR family transcriptional regulator [Phycisphaerales bacterium]